MSMFPLLANGGGIVVTHSATDREIKGSSFSTLVKIRLGAYPRYPFK
jgi:hypothetical protein